MRDTAQINAPIAAARRRWFRVSALSMASFVLGCVSFCLGAITEFFGSWCGNEVVESVLSPDGAKRVVVFQRDCGATTSFSTQVSVLDSDEDLPHEGSNLWSGVGRELHETCGTWVMNLDVWWTGPRDVHLRYDPRTLRGPAWRRFEVNGVTAHYHEEGTPRP